MSTERRLSDLRNLVSGLYTLGATIGTGHFAIVKLARHVFTQKEVAVKVIDKTKLDDVSKAHLFQEVMCMKLVQHPNVVRLYEVIDTTSKLYLILELGDGGDMYDYIMKHANGLNETIARRYFRQICRALKYCHEMHVCHRDLKPENLVFFEKQGVVKLTDFGFSNRFSPGEKLYTSCGSLAYSAPEILLGDPYDAPAIDIWSLGVILFMLVTGRAPFQEANDSETVMMILDCSYKLPPHISNECQNLIHRMIVREPDRRATLDEVMSDIWYRQCENDDDEFEDQHYLNSLPLISHKTISHNDHDFILQQMVDGNIADHDAILHALNENQYNHVTATYYLLAEKILHTQQQSEVDEDGRNPKRRRHLQPASEPFTEQIGVFVSSASNPGKENVPPTLTTPRHSIDLSNEPALPALVEDDEERPSLSRANTTTSATAATPTQAMKIILEEDENSESPPADKSANAMPLPGTHPKLNKILESEEEEEDEDEVDDDGPSTPNTTVIIGGPLSSDGPTTTSGLLRSKDLRSVVETKRRNFSRSCSSSDSEDGVVMTSESVRTTGRRPTRSPTRPTSLQESESAPGSIHSHRGRSLSNVENIVAGSSTDASATVGGISQQQLMNAMTGGESAKRRSFSRASSIASTTRVTMNGTGDELVADGGVSGTNLTLMSDRARSLSIEHRLANPSQMSIASRTSIRYSTPRESTVFTKTDAPLVVRLLQQSQHHDTTDAIRTIIEHQRLQQTPSHHELHPQTPIIVEEDVAPPVTSPLTKKSPVTKKTSNGIPKSNTVVPTTTVSVPNGHINTVASPTLSQNSVLSTLKISLLKHQQHKSPDDEQQQHRDSDSVHATSNKHGGRVCCTII